MMKKYLRGILVAGLWMGIAAPSGAQSVYDLRINEVMLFNTENYIDSYGQRSSWIEIMNLGYNTVNIGGCYLTDDPNQPRKYLIPKGDPVTSIPQRQFLVFFANGKSHHGVLHLNFTLDSTHRFVALYSSDGRSLIDSVTVPLSLPNTSYCRIPDGANTWQVTNFTTPNATNNLFTHEVTSGERFVQFDPFGIMMTCIAMLVVFIALIILYRIFRFTGNIMQRSPRIKKSESGTKEKAKEENIELSGEVLAAISAALYLYETEQHDKESEIITIQRVSRHYSPWSSKLYGLTQQPNRVVTHRVHSK
jgi:sodium pump decarboxylase gamma subunit